MSKLSKTLKYSLLIGLWQICMVSLAYSLTSPLTVNVTDCTAISTTLGLTQHCRL